LRFIREDEIGEGTPPRWGRLRTVIVAALAVLVVAGAVLAVRNFGRKPTHAAAPPVESSPTAALEGSADIRVFNQKISDRNDRPISYRGLLPLHPGDRVRLEVRLDKPAFIYLLWIAPSGDVIPVYPWKSGDWEVIREHLPASRLLYPSENSDGVPMKENVEGREVFLALARSTPLPSDVDLKAVVSRCATRLPTRKPQSLVRFRNHEVEATSGQDRDPDFLLPIADEDPFRRMADKLKREMGPYFEFVDGAAFASQIAVSRDEP
jgi:hypothetical protein